MTIRRTDRAESISKLPGAREEWQRAFSEHSPEQRAILRQIAETFAGDSVDVDALVQYVAECVAELYGAGVFVNLLTDDGRLLRTAGVHHPDPEAREIALRAPTLVRADQGFFPHVARSGTPLLLPNVRPEEVAARRPELREYAERVGVRSGVIVPLRARGCVIGTLNLMRAKPMRRVERVHQSFLEQVADHLALGIDGRRLAEALGRGGRLEPPTAAGHDESALSAREAEILGLLGRGLTNREIAETLTLSVRTVEWHRERLQLKLGVSGRAALVQAARDRGLAA